MSAKHSAKLAVVRQPVEAFDEPGQGGWDAQPMPLEEPSSDEAHPLDNQPTADHVLMVGPDGQENHIHKPSGSVEIMEGLGWKVVKRKKPA